MADAPDRPAEAAGDAAAPTANSVPTTRLLPPTGGETYRSLPPLAIIGLGLAVLYAAVVGGGTIVSLFNRTPYLMPTWGILWPLAALLLCWVARTQIQASEDTLGGQALVRWGIGLSLFFGLSYWAYYAATAIAVRQQAAAIADRWLTLLKESRSGGVIDASKLEQAFVMTQPPPWPRTDAPEWPGKLANQLDANPGNPRDAGMYTFLCETEITRTLQEGGADARFRLLGVEEWTEKEGGYRVRLRYRVQTPLVEYDLIVTTQGVWPRDSSQRQWYIVSNETTPVYDGSFHLLDEGRKLDRWAKDGKIGARPFVQHWTTLMSQGRFNDAFLATLPPAQRRLQERAECQALVLGPAAVLQDAGLRQTLTQRDDFRRNTFYHKAKEFYADEAVAKHLDDLLQRGLDRKDTHPSQFFLHATMPVHEQDERTVTFWFGTQIAGYPDLILTTRIAVQAERQALEKGETDAWRVVGVQLLRARAMPQTKGPPTRQPEPPG